MVHVLILVDGDVDDGVEASLNSAQIDAMVSAMRQAIASTASLKAVSHVVKLGKSDQPFRSLRQVREGLIICPLTLNVPQEVGFSQQALYKTCQDVEGLRHRVKQTFGILSGPGALWLPVALTAKGPLYAEVIGAEATDVDELLLSNGSPIKPASSSYYQPLHLPDRWRQVVYRLAGGLLRSLSAPPAVYLLQFGLHDDELYFDRLFPFPAAPAIASIGVQLPNLFMCHWRCLIGQPIQDLVILPRVH